VTKKRYKKEHIVNSVVAVIVDDDGRVLLTKRRVPPFLDLWVMPGGKVDLGEPILEALKREVHEEVGLEVEIQGLIDVFEHLTPGEDNCHFVILYYRCRPLYCDVVPNEHEVAEAAWVPADELAGYPMPAGARYILGKRFPELSLEDLPRGDAAGNDDA
jgi:8-oxo-dGTP diphosphatase